MNSEHECYVYIGPPGGTEFVTAGRFRLDQVSPGFVGTFVYGLNYRERKDAVELDPIELRLSSQVYETARMGGFFGAIRDSMPDFWGRRVIEKHAGLTQLWALCQSSEPAQRTWPLPAHQRRSTSALPADHRHHQTRLALRPARCRRQRN